MAQHVQHLPVAPSSSSLEYLEHPSPNHSFLVSVFVGVFVAWGFTLYLASSFKPF